MRTSPVGEVIGQVLALEGLRVAAADEAGIEVGLSGGVELIEDVEAEEVGFVDEDSPCARLRPADPLRAASAPRRLAPLPCGAPSLCARDSASVRIPDL